MSLTQVGEGMEVSEEVLLKTLKLLEVHPPPMTLQPGTISMD